jgi:hypothetical protein
MSYFDHTPFHPLLEPILQTMITDSELYRLWDGKTSSFQDRPFRHRVLVLIDKYHPDFPRARMRLLNLDKLAIAYCEYFSE